jgi:hypothetical protein
MPRHSHDHYHECNPPSHQQLYHHMKRMPLTALESTTAVEHDKSRNIVVASEAKLVTETLQQKLCIHSTTKKEDIFDVCINSTSEQDEDDFVLLEDSLVEEIIDFIYNDDSDGTIEPQEIILYDGTSESDGDVTPLDASTTVAVSSTSTSNQNSSPIKKRPAKRQKKAVNRTNNHKSRKRKPLVTFHEIEGKIFDPPTVDAASTKCVTLDSWIAMKVIRSSNH